MGWSREREENEAEVGMELASYLLDISRLLVMRVFTDDP